MDEMCDVTQDARSFDDSAHPRLVSTLVEPFPATRAVFKMCLFFDFMGVSCGVFGVPAVFSRALRCRWGASRAARADRTARRRSITRTSW